MSGDIMSFPDNWWTFVQKYQFADKDEIYTNGAMLIPSFRVRQMVEHYFGGEVGKTSRYHELFGTPERAARTLGDYCYRMVSCAECGIGCEGKSFEDGDAILEWLRGDAE